MSRILHDADLPFHPHENPNLDARTFHDWARNIAGGDVWSRDMIHPYHRWALAIATPEEWESWYGKTTFHQAPLYHYAIATVYALLGPDPAWIHWIQAGLGAGLVVLTFLTTRSLFGTRAAGATAILAAFCGPLILYEGVLLRTTLLAFLSALTLAVTLWAWRRPGLGAAAVLGLVQGVAWLAKPTLLASLPVLLLVACRHREADGPETRPAPAVAPRAAIFGVALLCAVFPAAVRNRIVDAPLTKITTRGPEVFVCGNAHGSTGIGWFPRDTEAVLLHGHARTILRENEGRLLPTISDTLATHPSISSFLGLTLRKVGALLSPLEIPNNVNGYAVRAAVPALSWLGWVGFGLIGPLALVGIGLSLRRPGPSLLAVTLLTLGFAAALAAFIVARFRVPLIPLFLPFAGLTVAHLGSGLLTLARPAATRPPGAPVRTGILIVAVAATAIVLHAWPVPFRPPTRAEALFTMAGHLQAAEMLPEADSFYERASAAAGDEEEGVRIQVLLRRAQVALARQRPDVGEGHLRRFFQRLQEKGLRPDSTTLRTAWTNLGIALDRQGKKDEARAAFEKAGEVRGE